MKCELTRSSLVSTRCLPTQRKARLGWRETEADSKRRNKRHNKSRERGRDKGGDTKRGEGEGKQKGNSRALKVLTRNLYFGADLQPVFEATSFPDLLTRVSEAFPMVHATNFPERVTALADEIAAIDPHLVGLQEVELWRSGTPVDRTLWLPGTPAETVEYDFLAILLSELAARGKDYAAVATVRNVDSQAPGFTDTGLVRDIRLTDHDVILARTDLPKNVFSVGDDESGNYADQYSVVSGLLGAIPVPRGWARVDVSLHGAKVRVVNTHLERSAPDIQEKQGLELLADGGPLDTALPTVLLGDLNSDANGAGTPGESDTATYANMLAAGFGDAWTTTRGNDAGFTWGHAEDLLNPEPTLTERIDFVLTRGNITASSANRVGHELEDRTSSGLWPSDHAGVWSVLHLKDD